MKPLDPKWTDMSEYVVHFTKTFDNKSEFENMMGIYAMSSIDAVNAFGIGRKYAPNPDSQKVACFSEVPLHLLDRLRTRRGEYGIGFKKELMVNRGAGPVLYAYKDTPHWKAIHDLMKRASDSSASDIDPIWKLTPFIEAPGDYGTSVYYFEWEREWRHVGHFSFDPEEVAFLIIPENLHESAAGFFQNALVENIGPAYLCPYVDSRWNEEQIRKSLSNRK